MEYSKREKFEDQIFDLDLTSENFHNKYFIRVGGKSQTFTRIDFSHTYFDNCYFRKMKFDSCNFNGCKFTNCNFIGSTFPGSKFEYATFDKTFIDPEILDNNCPSFNNLTLKFARTLRVNYQSIGDAKSVNKAIGIELNATKEHLYDSWHSKTAYYRNKYQGFKRLWMFFNWFTFKLEEIIWGHGEKPLRLIINGFLILCIIAVIDTTIHKNTNSISDYLSSFYNAPAILVGINKPMYYPNFLLSIIAILKFIGFALFTSIIIKRFNKR